MKKFNPLHTKLSRRNLLSRLPSGLAGAALSSPLWSRLISKAHAGPLGHQNLLVWHTPDGVVPEFFWPERTGAMNIRGDRLSDFSGNNFTSRNVIPENERGDLVLQPLSQYSDNILMVGGLRSNLSAVDHSEATGTILTGRNDEDYVSIDAYFGESYSDGLHVEPVLRLGMFPDTGYTHKLSTDLSGRYRSPSWQPVQDAGQVLGAVGGELPGGGGGQVNVRKQSRLASLGMVRQRVDALRCVAGSEAAYKLESYISELERLEQVESRIREDTGVSVTLDPDDPDFNSAQNRGNLVQMGPFMSDLIVTSLALDYAPAVTVHWSTTGTNGVRDCWDSIPFLENRGAGPHGLAHPNDDAYRNVTSGGSARDRIRLDTFFNQQLADIVGRLQSIPQGGGSMFDFTTILMVSEFGGPNMNGGEQHSINNLPFMIIAGDETPFRTGQYIRPDVRNNVALNTMARGLRLNTNSMGGTSSIIPEMLK